jgi:hypothetical protein
MGRSVLAVVVGYAVMAALVVGTSAAMGALFPGEFPKPGEAGPMPAARWFALMLGLSALYAVLGGWVAAYVAGRAEMGHGLALAALMLVLAVVSGLAERGLAPLWFLISVPLLGVAGVLAGSTLRLRQKE